MLLIWTKHTMPLYWTASCADDGSYTIHDVCDGSWILIAPDMPDQFFNTFEQAKAEAERLFGGKQAKKLLLTWANKTGQFASGELGYCGKVPFCSVNYDSCNPPEGKPWLLSMDLPGWRNFSMHFSTPGDAKAGAEEMLANWLQRAKLRPEE